MRRSRSCVPIRILLDHLEELEGLEDLASHVLGPHAIVSRTDAVSFATTVDLGHGAHASPPAEVQVADRGRCGDRHRLGGTGGGLVPRDPQESTSPAAVYGPGALLLVQDAEHLSPG